MGHDRGAHICDIPCLQESLSVYRSSSLQSLAEDGKDEVVVGLLRARSRYFALRFLAV